MRRACSREPANACCPDAKTVSATPNAAAVASAREFGLRFMLVMQLFSVARKSFLGSIRRSLKGHPECGYKSRTSPHVGRGLYGRIYTWLTVSTAVRRFAETVSSASRARVVSPPRCAHRVSNDVTFRRGPTSIQGFKLRVGPGNVRRFTQRCEPTRSRAPNQGMSRRFRDSLNGSPLMSRRRCGALSWP